jgi:hypothetical protein
VLLLDTWSPAAFAAVDSLVHDTTGKLRFHYAIVEVAALVSPSCRWVILLTPGVTGHVHAGLDLPTIEVANYLFWHTQLSVSIQAHHPTASTSRVARAHNHIPAIPFTAFPILLAVHKLLRHLMMLMEPCGTRAASSEPSLVSIHMSKAAQAQTHPALNMQTHAALPWAMLLADLTPMCARVTEEAIKRFPVVTRPSVPGGAQGNGSPSSATQTPTAAALPGGS